MYEYIYKLIKNKYYQELRCKLKNKLKLILEN